MLFRFFAVLQHPLQKQVLRLLLAIIFFPLIEKCINIFGLIKKNFIIYVKFILKNPGEDWICWLFLKQPATLKQSLYNQAPGNAHVWRTMHAMYGKVQFYCRNWKLRYMSCCCRLTLVYKLLHEIWGSMEHNSSANRWEKLEDKWSGVASRIPPDLPRYYTSRTYCYIAQWPLASQQSRAVMIPVWSGTRSG
jgi:hypothetical protein